MENFMKADVFFFITTIALIVVSGVLVVILIYLLRILREVFGLVNKVRKEGDEILDDVHSFRTSLKEEGGILTSRWRAFLSFFIPRSKSKRKSDTKKVRYDD